MLPLPYFQPSINMRVRDVTGNGLFCSAWRIPGKNTGVGCHFLLQCMKVKSQSEVLSRVRLLATPWTAGHQAPASMGFSRQEYWSGLPLPSPQGYMRTTNAIFWKSLPISKQQMKKNYVSVSIF